MDPWSVPVFFAIHDDRRSDVLNLHSHRIEFLMVNPWTVQDGPYWRSRAESLRKMIADTGTFRPETRARMIVMARNCDVLAARAEDSSQSDKSPDHNFSGGRPGRPKRMKTDA
jgi:hypothetical protein